MKRPCLACCTLAAVMVSATNLAWSATPSAFTATYQVLQGGQEIGQATVSLAPSGNGEWTYRNDSTATGGLAAMLGAHLHETTRLRWNHGLPETLNYDYDMQALKAKHRHLSVNAASHQVSVDEGHGAQTYAGVPGMVDHNTLTLALGLALASGQTRVTLPVAVRQTVEQQSFRTTGKEAVQVPAGPFQATKLVREGSDSFTAWYVPQKYLVPVKLAQSDGDKLELDLVRYQPR